jgi:hypothetical protein
MDQSTGNRKPVVVTGDLDGHIFSVHADFSVDLFLNNCHSSQPNYFPVITSVKFTG